MPAPTSQASIEQVGTQGLLAPIPHCEPSRSVCLPLPCQQRPGQSMTHDVATQQLLGSYCHTVNLCHVSRVLERAGQSMT